MRHLWAALLLLLWPGSAPAQQEDPAIAAVDRYFAERTTSRAFNGVVLIGRGDEIAFLRAYGMADLELGTPLQSDHIFRIGSLTKPVTALAVLRAVEQGRLALETPICERLDPCHPAWAPVTVAHLLSHRSGIADRFGDLESAPVDETATELARVIGTLGADETLRFAPGSDYQYSNFNYVLLGIILERAEGRTWRQTVRAMAESVGAASIDYDEVYTLVPGRVRGYDRSDDGMLRLIEYDDHSAHAAGGLLATVPDFFRWSRAALQARLISAAMRDRMVTPTAGNYGYGWQVRRFVGERVYNHSGGIDGFSTHVAYYPDRDLTIIVFSNVEADSAILSACDAAALYFDFSGRRGEDVATITAREPRERCGL